MRAPQGSYNLPDIPEPTLPNGEDTAGTSIPPTLPQIGGPSFAETLESPLLADWARTLLNQLRERIGAASERELLRSFVRADGTVAVPNYLRHGQTEATWLCRFLTSPEVDASVQRAWWNEGFLADDPAWLEELLAKERAHVARCFLLTGNIADYAFDPTVGYRPGVNRLQQALCAGKECVLLVSLSQGIRVLSRHDRIQDRLPREIRELLEQRRFDMNQALVGQVCSLFDRLRTWLEDETEFSGGVGIIFENIHLIISPEAGGLERNFLIDSLLSWSVSPQLFHKPHCLVLMADSLEGVSNELRALGGKIEQIEITRPSSAAVRLKFLLPLLQPRADMVETRAVRQRSGVEISGYSGDWVAKMRQIAHDTAGLTLMGIEDILQHLTPNAAGGLHQVSITSAKRERLKAESEGLLEIITPQRTLKDLGGYPALKLRLGEIIHSLQHASNELVRSTVPMGILLLGPPGTGKTVAAEAIAGESGISMAKLGDFRGMYVGQSERNLTRLLALIESLHPVIVFIDELDQSEGSRGDSGDNSVSKRVFSKLLQFMSDTTHRGRILWIGASNRPDLIDAAMKRAGRFDLVLPFLLPDLESRADIFRIVLAARLRSVNQDTVTVSVTAADYAALAGASEGFSGAEIEAIIGEVLRRAAQRFAGSGTTVRIHRSDIEAVMDVYVPPQVRDHYSEMEDLALKETSFLDLLPEAARERRARLAGDAARSRL